RVIAYSTISQLGYMMLGLGSGAMALGIFHLFNHAFFKALLFLGAGSVNHATGTFDMRRMGGLRRVMPWTFGTFLVASLSLAGIWPLAGFWSKDEILAHAWEEQRLLFYLGMATVFLTAFYIFRVLFLTFGGEYRGGHSQGHEAHLHESPPVMVAPMAVLAVLAVVSGWFNLTGGFGRFLGEPGEAHSVVAGLFGILAHPLPWISLALAGLGIGLAYAMYSAKIISAEGMGRVFSPLYTLFSRKYWFDELYEKVIVVRVLVDGLFWVMDAYDSGAVDGMVNSVAGGALGLGRAVRRVQTGQLQFYALAIALGLVLIMAGLYYFT
ncbi:MAG: NADH-quinone oxidoreductase subunit L, partial [Dehalococcoidia bacterium]